MQIVVTRGNWPVKPLVRHARPCAGHPRLSSAKVKTWMAGHRRAEATPSFGRLCPAMTVERSRYHTLTILPHPAVAEDVDDALPDRRLGGLERRRDPERDHQRPHRDPKG